MDASVQINSFLPRGFGRLNRLISLLPSQWTERAAVLAYVIRQFKPDFVHTLEFQLGGYLTLQAKSILKEHFPPWIVTNWGSDIYLYGQLSAHAEKIKAILSNCDYYGSECQRDVMLARTLGFKGEAMPVLPIAGGFDIERMQQFQQPGKTSDRRIIALKGYQHWAGRSLVGLQAVKLSANALKDRGYRVAIYLTNPDVDIAAELIANDTGLPIDIIPPCSHEDILGLHGRARASIGLSISDGLSTSALEAMIMGSFPIQSDTSCLNELTQDGETALIVPAEDPYAVAQAIRRAVTDDTLVDRAAEINKQTAVERLSHSAIRPQVVEMYRRLKTASSRV